MTLQLNQKDFIDQDPTHLYIDLDITNSDFEGYEKPKNLIFNEVRNTPYLVNPSKYFFSVIRFQLDTPTLPVFIPIIEPFQADYDQTIYQLAMSYAGVEITESVKWETEEFTTLKPPTPVRDRQINSTYYYSYTYRHFINLLNNTLYKCLQNLPTLPKPFAQMNVPQFNYDENTNKISLIADSNYFNTGTGLNPTSNTTILIYCNAPLKNLLSGFETVDYGYPPVNPSANPLQFRFKIYPTVNNLSNIITPPSTLSTVYYITMTSEQLDITIWNPIKSIVFTTGLIPVRPTMSSPPNDLGTDTFSTFGNNSNLISQITDFIVPFSVGNTYKPNITYICNSEYRLIDITSELPFYSMQINVSWKNVYGDLIPFSVPSGSAGSIKILFRRKDFNTIKY
jgi:hypothetical protein